MAINYPDSPTLGQTASYSNGNLVVWNGNSWRVSSSPITTYGVATLNFGFTGSQEGDTTTATITNSNTKLTSLIIINSSTSSNHDSIEDSLIEDIKYEISDKIEGVGFTIYAYAPMGTWGEYNIEYKIIN
jgi:hypothetical protein